MSLFIYMYNAKQGLYYIKVQNNDNNKEKKPEKQFFC